MQNVQTQKKKGGGILRLIFSRTAIALMFLLIQIYFMFVTFRWLEEKAYAFFVVLSLLAALGILNSRMNGYYKMAWVIPVLTVPVFGVLFYLFLRFQKSSRRIAEKVTEAAEETKPYLRENRKLTERIRKEDPQEYGILRYTMDCGGYPAYENTSAQYFSMGEDFFPRLKEELRKAKRFIFMEYFIVAHGEIWDGPDGILEILKQKAEEGVEVRFMYDGMCSVTLLPYYYPKELELYGIQCKMFSPLIPALVSYQNNRDHRKITVIDGNTAFTGGVNLADEYANIIERFGVWKDTGVMIKGSAVEGMTMMFLQQWYVTEPGVHEYEKYRFRHSEDCFDDETARDGVVLPYADNPFDNEAVGAQIYIAMLNAAQRYCHIMTPYLILEDTMINALQFAAKRGVDVVIMMPRIPDKWYAYWVAKSYYDQLIESGVKIVEYQPGFVHAKVAVSDDIRAVVGSINLDFRSLYLHFENACYLYRKKMILDIEKDFVETMKRDCVQVTREDMRRYPLYKRAVGGVLRLAAPLM